MSRYSLTSKNISGEIIDNELIVVDLVRGVYFNATGAGPLIWKAIVLGMNVDAAIDVLASRASDPAVFVAAAREWVAMLVDDGVLVAEGEGETVDPAQLFDQAGGETVELPMLERFNDLEDLLLFDPIHDFDELGWPKQPGA